MQTSTNKSFLTTPIEYLKGVGPERADILKKELEIFTFGDLLKLYPYRYIDRTQFYSTQHIDNTQTYIQLKGKLRAWMGDADNYFLNNAMRMLDESLKKASPPFEGKIEFSPGKGHCWMGLTEAQMMAEMAQAMKKP